MDTNPDAETSRTRAFRTWVQPELELLYAMAMRLTRNPHEAEDLVQDTLLRAYRAINSFDGRYPRAWLLTILRNTNINNVRKKKPVLAFDPDHTFGQLPAAGVDGHDGTAQKVVDAIPDPVVVAALEHLSRDHRTVVALVDIDGLTYSEAAEVLGVPIATVTSRLHRARRQLRDELQAAGHLRGKRS